MNVLAADLGGTWLRTAVLREGAPPHATQSLRLRSVFDGLPPDEIWRDVVAAIGAAARRDAACDVQRIALAFPGPLAGGTPLAAPTLTGSAPVPADLAARIERAAGRPVTIVNDVAAATAFLASRTDDRDFLVVTVSSGIGGRVHRARAHRTLTAHDGEIGHLIVDDADDAPPCDCGGRGHLGAIASGRAFERRARIAAAGDPVAFGASACARAGATPSTLTNEDHLVPALRNGDPWSTELLRRSVTPLARFALDTVVACGLQRVYVIGGFAAALGDIYRAALADGIARRLDSPALRIDPRALVRVVDPGIEASLYGAALHA